MKCKTCEKPFFNSICAACGDSFISCDCTIDYCLDCQSFIYTNPAHRFSIALFALQECAPYAFCKLSEVEEEAKKRLLLLIKKIAEEMRERK